MISDQLNLLAQALAMAAVLGFIIPVAVLTMIGAAIGIYLGTRHGR